MTKPKFPKSRKKHSLEKLEKVPYEQSIPHFLEQNKTLLQERENLREAERIRTQQIAKNVIVGGPLDVCTNAQTKNPSTELVEERVQKIFKRLDFCLDSGGLIDSVKLANALGFEVIQHKGLPGLMNGIITSDSNGKQMAINDNLSKEKKRYSITYLLSTYLLCYQNQDFFKQQHTDFDEDTDSSYMARLLLIPEPLLSSVISQNESKDSKSLANAFQVPIDIMEERLDELHKSKAPVYSKLPSKINN